MIALIDIGNTRTKFCLVNEGKREKIQITLNSEFDAAFLTKHFNRVEKIVVASVSKQQYTLTVKDWCKQRNINYLNVVSEKSKLGVSNAYEQPERLGIDRWLALIGAAEQFPQKNILIIDAGTATTIDFLTADGKHQGGWILAGIDTLIESVLANTSQVKANQNEAPSIDFGLDTSTNVHNAAWAATIGSINVAIAKVEQQGCHLDEMLLTGGNAQLISSLIAKQTRIIEELVFNGLQAYI